MPGSFIWTMGADQWRDRADKAADREVDVTMR